MVAVVEQRMDLLECLMSNNRHTELFGQKDLYDNTGLHLAVLGSSPEIVKLLLDKGMPKDNKNKVNVDWAII